jgi:hypothetical protein
MRPAILRPPRSDFHIGTLRFLAGRARRALDAHDRQAQRNANPPADARARLERIAQLTQRRLTDAQRRRDRPGAELTEPRVRRLNRGASGT